MAVPPLRSPLFRALSGLLRVTRIWNLVILVAGQYFTAIFLASGDLPVQYIITSTRMFLLSLSSAMIAAAGYVINDYYDIKIDLINKPDRVVVGKLMRRRVAMFMHIALSLGGVFLGLLVSWKLALVNFLSAGLLWL